MKILIPVYLPTLLIFIILDLLYGFVTAVRCFLVIPIVAIVGCGGGKDVYFSCCSRKSLFNSCSKQNHRRSVSPWVDGFLHSKFSGSRCNSMVNQIKLKKKVKKKLFQKYLCIGEYLSGNSVSKNINWYDWPVSCCFSTQLGEQFFAI